jgi:putative ABC transport system ATP-binding protein
MQVTKHVRDLAPDSASEAAQAAVRIRDLKYGYGDGPDLLRIHELTVARAERVFLHGPSGSGKSTLLGLVAGVLKPRSGLVEVLGHDLGRLGASKRDALRGARLGYVFQMFNLIPYLSVVDNITLPCLLSRERRRRLGKPTPDEAARALAEQLGIAELLGQDVTRLSIGQQQRVAAARALIGSPELVVADEPTSALDADRRQSFLDLLFRCCQAAGAALLFVSHDRSLAGRFDRALSLSELNQIAPC